HQRRVGRQVGRHVREHQEVARVRAEARHLRQPLRLLPQRDLHRAGPTTRQRQHRHHQSRGPHRPLPPRKLTAGSCVMSASLLQGFTDRAEIDLTISSATRGRAIPTKTYLVPMAIDSPKSATSQASASHRSAATSSLTPISSGTRFKPDFQTWLKANGYGDYDFAKNPNALPSFGGKSKPGEKLTHQPVILIHGNGDSAAGWNDVVAGYKRAGYKDSEIYAMSWGDGKAASAGNNYHSEHYLREVRGFIQAVKDYTAADKVDVIGHSMGVTLARKAIKGGTGPDQASPGGKYDLGKPITDEVDTFVGISGANEGLQSCDLLGNPNPTSSTLNGFSQHSKFLHDLNADPTREGD